MYFDLKSLFIFYIEIIYISLVNSKLPQICGKWRLLCLLLTDRLSPKPAGFQFASLASCVCVLRVVFDSGTFCRQCESIIKLLFTVEQQQTHKALYTMYY